jgi:hypothetical protein
MGSMILILNVKSGTEKVLKKWTKIVSDRSEGYWSVVEYQPSKNEALGLIPSNTPPHSKKKEMLLSIMF